MSDTEAGDSGLAENPEPEDDADLSALGAADVGGESAEAELAEVSAQSSAASQHESNQAAAVEDRSNARDSGASSYAPAESSEERQASDSATVAAVQADVTQSFSIEQSCLPKGVSGAEGDTDGHKLVEGGEMGDIGLPGTESSASLQCENVQAEGEPQAGITDSAQGETGHPSSYSLGSSDMEESPPEDELFGDSGALGPTESSQATAPESEAGTEAGVLQNDLAAHSGSSDRTAGADESVVSSDMVKTGHTAVSAETPTENPDQVSSPQECDAVVDTVSSTLRVGEKEDDQVPECDREQTVPSSSSSYQACSDQEHAAAASILAESSEQNSGPIRTTVDNNVAVAKPSAEQPQASVCLHSAENKVQAAVCDTEAPGAEKLSAQSNVPSSPAEASAQQTRTSSVAAASNSGQTQKSTFPSSMDSDDEDLLTELDAELHLPSSPRQQQQLQRSAGAPGQSGQVQLLNGLKQVDWASSELCQQFEQQLLQLQEQILQKDREIGRLEDEKARQRQVSQEVMAERDRYKAELTVLRDKNPDDLYLPQIKELEYTIAQQQTEIQQLKEKLTVHDSAAKRAIATLQNEMKARIDQITKLYEDSCKEKDSMVVRFAEAETKNIEAKRAVEKMESRVRDVLKEKEFMNNKMRAALADRQKAIADLDAKSSEMSAMQKEMEKLKEDLQSTDYRIKWFQNKLKAELEAHKETKQNLEKTTIKLKEAKEETEVIRRDCQAIIKTYQESEEVRSNSLDKELKLKETELMIKTKEKSDTEEVHQVTKRELDALKVKHKDAIEELKTLKDKVTDQLKDKVQCFEDERLTNEQVQNKYQTIIQNQKAENTNLQKQLADMRTLKEDFDRAQDMIKNLDHEISDLKITNRDLTKDIEGCQARESKMLSLQSELSRTNALLRSENTNLNNQVVTLSGEVQKMTMDLQDLETRCRNVTEQLEEEQKKRKEETTSLTEQLTTKTKECDEYKQKWEDEIDANKTLKRKHAHNVKDLTRQLQHAKKRLEAYETGSGDRDTTSMGSRTNSNGSLNSVDAANQHSANHHGGSQHNHQPPAPQRRQSQEPDYPVITEQVEVDKQVLIERIVRLQRSLARKNEKIEFLEEHIQQLVDEIKKKNKIIQGYIMREEAGTLVSDDMDANKALLARKGGIMASVYSMHQQDGHMTLDLSLEINRKLQAVLEDTLLKNMTLKENLDTLGAEIARLSQENRRLQLHLQQIQAH